MQRVVHLPENRTVTLGAYVAAWKTVLAAPEDSTFQNGFNWYPESRKEVLREFRRGLHDRINRRIDGFPGTLKPRATHGRKFEHEWQIETYRASRQLNHPRLIIDWLPLWLHSRFKHRLRSEMVD
jgi:hypothetical protein